MDHKILPLSLTDKGYISCDEACEKATCKIQNGMQKSQGESDRPSTQPDDVSSAATAPLFQNKLPETLWRQTWNNPTENSPASKMYLNSAILCTF